MKAYICDGSQQCQLNHKEQDCETQRKFTLQRIVVRNCVSIHIDSKEAECLPTDPLKFKKINPLNHFNQYLFPKAFKLEDCPDGMALCKVGNQECFLQYKRCMFERDIYGSPVHCKSTEHLKFCALHECPDAFKCPDSYCIPVHMVCDNIDDCPNKEDEHGCSNVVDTHGMLRCKSGDIFVHRKHICDDVVHCMDSFADEFHCDHVRLFFLD